MIRPITPNKHGILTLNLTRLNDDGTVGDKVRASVNEELARAILLDCLMFLAPTFEELMHLSQKASDLNYGEYFAESWGTTKTNEEDAT